MIATREYYQSLNTGDARAQLARLLPDTARVEWARAAAVRAERYAQALVQAPGEASSAAITRPRAAKLSAERAARAIDPAEAAWAVAYAAEAAGLAGWQSEHSAAIDHALQLIEEASS